MAKKLVLVWLTITMVTFSSISICYATDVSTGDVSAISENEIRAEEIVTKDSGEKIVTKLADKNSKGEKVKKQERYKKGLAAYIRHVNPRVGKKESNNMAGYFIKAGNKYNVDEKILMAIAKNESTFYSKAKNPAGYKGLMQTSNAVARKYGYKPSSLLKANVSINVGARYLGGMVKRLNSVSKGISAYGYGEYAVRKGCYRKGFQNKILKERKNIRSYLKNRGYI